MANITLLTQRLAEAENAHHLLMMSEKVVTLAYSLDGNNQMQYNQTSIDKLEAYISKLKEQITRASGGRGRGPIFLA